MRRIVVNTSEVSEFVCRSVGSTDTQCYGNMGLEVAGKIVAGALWDNYSGANCFIHFSTTLNIIPRDFLRWIFGYLFDGVKVTRVTAAFSSRNTKVLRLAKLIG